MRRRLIYPIIFGMRQRNGSGRQSGQRLPTADASRRTGRRFSRAVRQGQVRLAYQPIVDVATGRPCAAEALIRWDHPRRGPISPTDFVPALESSGRGERLDDFVLETAAAKAGALRSRGMRLPISVNLSPARFLDPGLPERIASLRERWRLEPSALRVELTERALDAGDRSELNVEALAANGVDVALDDFGVGYSALQRLVRLPLSMLKLDRSFVGQMHANPRAAVVVRSAVELAHGLHLEVIAEGVESADAWHRLRELGVESAQGFGIARPLASEHLEDWVTEHQEFNFELADERRALRPVNGSAHADPEPVAESEAPTPLHRHAQPVAG
jgi:EAL domain-containing protein (putative c-di-GMP-specific phosphodiesterase class I)